MAQSQVTRYYLSAFLLLLAAVAYQVYTHLLADAAHDGLAFLVSSRQLPRVQLLVGVASHLENVDQRQAVRRSWKRLARPAETEVIFFAPERLCDVDDYWRLRRASCQPWNIFVPVNINENVPVRPYRVQPSMVRPSRSVDGVSFMLKFPVAVTQLGISKRALKLWASRSRQPRPGTPLHERAVFPNITVEIVNARNGFTEISANFSLVELETIPSDDGFVYLRVDEETYPRNFEGILRISPSLSPVGGHSGLSCNLIWNKMFGEDGLVYFTNMLMGSTALPFSTNSCPLATMTYQVPDLLELRQIMGARETQNKCQANKNRNLQGKLVEEMEDFGDVLHIPDLVDTPSNLPLAALGFFRHAIASYNFDYLVLTHDRAFLAIDQLLPRLQSAELSSEAIWRSNFRRLEPVTRHGEDAEIAYHSSHYPPLPAASGSVLSYDLVRYLSDNADALSSFSGVSASLGVWLAPLNPQTLDEGEWTNGNETCSRATVAYGPIWDKERMKECWNNYKKCNKICECS